MRVPRRAGGRAGGTKGELSLRSFPSFPSFLLLVNSPLLYTAANTLNRRFVNKPWLDDLRNFTFHAVLGALDFAIAVYCMTNG